MKIFLCKSCSEIIDENNSLYVEDYGYICHDCYNKKGNKYFTCSFCDIEFKIKKEYIEEDMQGKYIRCPNCDTTQNIEG